MRFPKPITILLLALLLLPFQLSATPTPALENTWRAVVSADGAVQQIAVDSRRAADILVQAGIEVAPEDRLLSNGLPVLPSDELPAADPLVLQVQRAVAVRLDGKPLRTTAATVAAAFWETGTRLRTSDQLSVPQGAVPQAGMSIAHTPSRPVSITVGNQTIRARTAPGTVGEALQEAGLALQGLDTSMPAPGERLPEDGNIRVVRVEEEVILEQASLPFETLTQPAPDVEIDQTRVVQAGQFGLQASRIRVRYEDGVEVSRTTEAEWVAVEPKPRILGYGTKIVVRTLNTPGGAVEYWRAVPAFATSYSPCRLGTDACGSTTASGLPLKKGMVGVIRSWYNAMALSQVYVEGYGVGVIADIGAGVSGQHWIDLGYSDDDWQQWAGTVTIYFLTPVPPPDQILWILP